MTIIATPMPVSVPTAVTSAAAAASHDPTNAGTVTQFDTLLQEVPSSAVAAGVATSTPSPTPATTPESAVMAGDAATGQASPAEAPLPAPGSEQARQPHPTRHLAELIAQLGLGETPSSQMSADPHASEPAEPVESGHAADGDPADAAALSSAPPTGYELPPAALQAANAQQLASARAHAAPVVDSTPGAVSVTGIGATGTGANRAFAAAPHLEPAAPTSASQPPPAEAGAEVVLADAALHAPPEPQLSRDGDPRPAHSTEPVDGLMQASAVTTTSVRVSAASMAGPVGSAPAVLPQVAMPDRPDGGFADDFQGRIGVMLDQGIGHARIRIAPEHLGAIDLQLKVDGDLVTAQFNSGHADVRAAIEHTLPRLRDALASQGLQLAQAQVGGGGTQPNTQHGQQPHQDTPEPVPSQYRESQTASAVAVEDGDGVATSPAMPLRQVGLVDTYA